MRLGVVTVPCSVVNLQILPAASLSFISNFILYSGEVIKREIFSFSY